MIRQAHPRRWITRGEALGPATWLLAGLIVLALAGCRQPVAQAPEPEFARALPEGAFGLRRLAPAEWPDLGPVADQLGDPGFQQALGRSLAWYGIASTRQHFPIGPISHAHAHASAFALGEIARLPRDERYARLHQDFDVWQSVGWDGGGEVLFTGYFSPTFRASATPTGPFRHPLYRRPDDLATDPATGAVLGQRLPGGRLVAYPSRAELEDSGALRGLELVYLADPLDAYLVQVNGSAKLQMLDGSTRYVGYAGTNGREYTSIARILADRGELDPNRLSLGAVKAYFRDSPGELTALMRQNERFVFFRFYEGDSWPAGSLGFRVTPGRTLATDKAIFPRGAAVLVEAKLPPGAGLGSRPAGGGGRRSVLMVDQDTGGAIRAAGRADVFVGIGDAAEPVAGSILSVGRMYYLLLRPDRAGHWHERLTQQRAVADASADR